MTLQISQISFAFAFGFAMGTYVGLVIEEKLSIIIVILRIVTTDESNEEIASFLQSENFEVTSLDAKGARGNVKMILTLVNRINVARITEHLPTTNPHAFFSIEDVRYANQGVFRPKKPKCNHRIFPFICAPRKEKIINPACCPVLKFLIRI